MPVALQQINFIKFSHFTIMEKKSLFKLSIVHSSDLIILPICSLPSIMKYFEFLLTLSQKVKVGWTKKKFLKNGMTLLIQLNDTF